MSIISPICGKSTKRKYTKGISSRPSKPAMKVYHDTYSGAIRTAIDYAESKGYVVDEDDIFSQISVGPKRPREGQTNRFILRLTKDGKPQKKALAIQVYGMKNSYELNAYIS
jgi:hypothetical protein